MQIKFGEGEYEDREDIAVIGVACRFPGARDAESFWQSLRLGKDCISEIPAKRWPLEGFFGEGGVSTSKWGGFVDDLARFDASFFGISESDAVLMDPIQRLFSEVAWTAMEHAGYGRPLNDVVAGIFVGARSTSYGPEYHRANAGQGPIERGAILGYSQNYVAAWLADRLDLRGPAMVVDTACSSSLVSTHLACESLRRFECEIALSGGVDLLLSPMIYRFLSGAQVLSPRGRCRVFDEGADGYVPGEGAGAIVLKRAADALRDGDTIHAIIRGSAMNNDGHTVGITTPNVKAQESVIRQALRRARVPAESVSYVEVHGTGTQLGDPIEMRALTQAFGDGTRSTCAVGSVKSNIGHLHCASGIAGLIKVILALSHREIPPTLHCVRPNPRFRFGESPFYPNQSLKPWLDEVRRAGVSSFGFGGTNCHMVLESAPAPARARSSARGPWLFSVSAPDRPALVHAARRYGDAIRTASPEELSALSFTTLVGRKLHAERALVVADGLDAAADGLVADAATAPAMGQRSRKQGVAFLFPGQGTQSVGMCRQLYDRFPRFREVLEDCHERLRDALDVPLLDLIYPARTTAPLVATRYAQPALFAVEYALARLWESWGIRPAAVMGHSFGEYAAACIAGMLTLEDALRLVVARGRLTEERVRPGAMAAILASERDVAREVAPYAAELSVAAVNGEQNTVIAGTESAVAEVSARFRARDVRVVPLKISHPYHCPLTAPMVPDFREVCLTLTGKPPSVPFVSNVTGAFKEDAPDADYWVSHVLRPVRFADSLRLLHEGGYRRFVEVGPGNTLLKLAEPVLRGAAEGDSAAHLLPSWLREKTPLLQDRRGTRDMLESLAQLVRHGASPAFSELFRGEPSRRLPMPTYDFQGKEYPVTLLEAVSAPESGADSDSDLVLSGDHVLMQEHVFRGNAVLPGAALWGLVVAAAHKSGRAQAKGLRSVAIVASLALRRGETAKVAVAFDGAKFEVRAARSDVYTVLARGELLLQEPAPHPWADADGQSVEVSPERVYEHLRSVGLQYGPSFRLLAEIRSSRDGASAKLLAPLEHPAGFAFPPQWVDAAMQSLAGIPAAHGYAHEDVFVPFALDTLVLRDTAREAAFVSARFRTPLDAGEVLRADVRISDARARVLVELRGLSLKRTRAVPSTQPTRAARAKAYGVHWAVAAHEERGAVASGPWVVLHDGGDRAEELVRDLEANGVRAVEVIPGSDFARLAPHRYTVSPSNVEHLVEVFRGMSEPPRRIVHAWNTGSARSPDIEMRRGVHTLAALVSAGPSQSAAELSVLTTSGVAREGVHTIPERAALLALTRVARNEVPGRVVGTVDSSDGESWWSVLRRLSSAGGGDLRSEEGAFRTPRLAEREWLPGSLDVEPGEVCVVTGGASGLGKAWALHLARKYRVPVAIIGRRSPAEGARIVAEIEAAGGSAVYHSADVAETGSLARALERIRERFGAIGAVFHAAGVLRDGPLRSKNEADFQAVFAPKIEGARNLERLTASDPLRYFVVVSSLAAVHGNVGQADYAAANAWLDAFVFERRRRGLPANSVAFSLVDVGMGQGKTLKELARASGVTALTVDEAIDGFERALEADEAYVLVGDLDLERMASRGKGLPAESDTWKAADAPRTPPRGGKQRLERAIRERLRGRIAALLGQPEANVEGGATFLSLGLDSASLIDMVRSLEREVGIEFYPTLFFEYPSLDELARHFADEHASVFEAWLFPEEKAKAAGAEHTNGVAGPAVPFLPAGNSNSDAPPVREEGIAIIGMAGRFPGAPNLETFWMNLAAGVDAIREVPAHRWSMDGWFDRDRTKEGTSYSRWGGFLEKLDEFDALFFNISPREAEVMDPQQRLFMEVAWETLENAGYAGNALRGSGAGVFVGVTYTNYLDEMMRVAPVMSGYSGLGNSRAVVPNRISHFLDWHGPSMMVDTLCSSSLVAVKLACDSLRRGECSVALAGGVHAMLTSWYYVFLSRMGTLATEGRCRTFDALGDGFVPGEGVGAVLLKPLQRALLDGDTVHAVIRGGALNHGGRAQSLSAPNPRAQTALLLQAFEDAGVDPDTLGYVEAHGSGTALGDPIEFNALTDAFRSKTARYQFCALGSVKSNIGHLEPAAGIAGLLKVVSMLKTGIIPPTLHFDVPNPYLPWQESPFIIPTRAMTWPRAAHPRRAGVSGFGLSGANAHLVLEEAPEVRDDRPSSESPHVIFLSARSEDALSRLEQSLRDHIETSKVALRLSDIAFTLASGRAQLRYRSARIVGSLDELKDSLVRPGMTGSGAAPAVAFQWKNERLEEQKQIGSTLVRLGARPSMFVGKDIEVWGPKSLLSSEHQDIDFASRAPAGAVVIDLEAVALGSGSAEARRRRLLEVVGRLFCGGVEISAKSLFPEGDVRRIPVPTYPFERERYWFPLPEKAASVSAPANHLLHRVAFRVHTRNEAEQGSPQGTWLYVGSPGRLASSLQRRFEEAGARLVIVEAVPSILRERIASLGGDLAGVVHSAALEFPNMPGGVAGVEARLEYGVMSLFAVVQGVLGLARAAAPRLLIVTSGGSPLHTSGPSQVEAAAMAGFARSLAVEAPSRHVQLIDLEPGLGAGEDSEAIWREILCGGPLESVLAKGERFVRRLESIPVHDIARTLEAPVRPGGVYLVTGGTRGIGRTAAERIAVRGPCRIVLQGLEELPPELSWASLLAATDTPRPLRDKLQHIHRLRSMGAQVSYMACDVADADAMRKMTDRIHAEHGPIDGIVHAAGRTADALLQNKDASSFATVLNPKIRGALLLDELTQHDPVRFFVLFSSLSGVTGNAGQSDYAAANAWLDRFAEERQLRGRGKTVSIAWSVWAEKGSTSKVLLDTAQSMGLTPLVTADGEKVFDWILDHATPPSVVVGDFSASLMETLHQWWATERAKGATSTVEKARPPARSDDEDAVGEVERLLTEIVAAKLKLPVSKLGANEPLAEFGLDSFTINELVVELGRRYEQAIHPSVVFEYSTIRALARFLAGEFGAPPNSSEPRASSLEPRQPLQGRSEAERVPVHHEPPRAVDSRSGTQERVAVVGMACRFPKAGSIDELWKLFTSGESAISEAPYERWGLRRESVSEACRYGGFLDDIAGFDPACFRMDDAQALLSDPHQRLFLEVALEALEDAGCAGKELAGSSTGVFVGSRESGYYAAFFDRLQDVLRQRDDLHGYRSAVVGSLNNYVAAHVAHHFDFRGPAMTLESACSSSLVAIHMACRALQAGDCEQALVGGVDLKVTAAAHALFEGMRATAPDGRPRVFDADATGFVPGEGAGAVVLKPLSKALADGHHIYGVILASSTNNDGRAMGLTTPSLDSQIALLERVYDGAGIDPGTIELIEPHGTGTALGDPIEVKALRSVFEQRSARIGATALTSGKSVMGHLDTAAGVAGFIRVLLSLSHRELPPTLHCDEPNPRFGFERSAFFLNDRLRPWTTMHPLRRAAVSSLGLGGTNAHVVVEEWRDTPEEPRAELPELAVLGANSHAALERRVADLRDWLVAHPDAKLRDVAFSLSRGRQHPPVRAAFFTTSRKHLLEQLAAGVSSTPPARKIAFLFTGQGSFEGQRGSFLAEQQPDFRAAIEECEAIVRRLIGRSVRESREAMERAPSTALAHCALVASEIAMARMWMALGVVPDAVAGHSLGEYAAAAVAGVLSLEDTFALLCERARLLDGHALAGSMIAVLAPREEVVPLLSRFEKELTVAAHNGPNSTVVAGLQHAIEAFTPILGEQGLRYAALRVAQAFHSPAVAPIVEPYLAFAARIPMRVPAIPFFSTVTGTRLKGPVAKDHWGRHTAQPVLFKEAVEGLLAEAFDAFIEVGPGVTLTRLVGTIADAGVLRVPTSQPDSDDRTSVLKAVASLYAAGVDVNWGRLPSKPGARRISLPKTPFVRRRFWPDSPPSERVHSASQARVEEPIRHAGLPPMGPLVDRCLARGPGFAVYEKLFEHHQDPTVAHHLVLEHCILPAVGYWDMALVAGSHALGRPVQRLREISIFAPLVVDPKQPTRCQIDVTWEGKSPERGEFRVMTVVDEGGGEPQFRIHASGKMDFHTDADAPPLAVSLDAYPRRYEAGSTYSADYSHRSGVTYGTFFQTLGRMGCGEQTLLAELAVTSESGRRSGAPDFQLHPGLLDGALQSWAGFRLGLPLTDDVFVPMFVQEVQMFRPLLPRVRAYVELARPITATAETLEGQTTLIDDSGRPLLRIRGFTMKRVDGRQLLRRPAPSPLLAWRWEEDVAADPRPVRGRWLVLGDGLGLGQGVAQALRSRGAEVIEVSDGAKYVRLGTTRFRMTVDCREHYERLLREIDVKNAPLTGVVHALAFAPSEDVLETPSALQDALDGRVTSAISLAGALDRAGCLAAPLPIWFAMNHGFHAQDSDPVPSPDRSVLCAAVRALHEEHPSLEAYAVDLGGASVNSAVDALVRELERGSRAALRVLRDGRTLVRVPSAISQGGADAHRAGPGGVSLPENARYVVTGGRTGIGQAVAQWLAGRGAKIAILGRTAHDGGAAVDELRRLGASDAMYVAADVSDVAQVRDAKAEILRRFGGVDVVIHGAGVPAEPGRLIDKEAGDISRVLAPKVAGTRNLVEAFPAAQWVFFSSVAAHGAGLARGLGEYAMANAFLDGMAASLRARGCASTAIAWGPWGDVGMLARERGVEVMESKGFHRIETASGLAMFEQALRANEDSVIAAPHDARKFRLLAPTEAASKAPAVELAPLPELVEERQSDPAAGTKVAAFGDLLAEQISESLSIPGSRIDRRRKFMDLGLDSLSLLGLAKALEKRLGLTLYPSVYFEYPTIEKLAEHIAELKAERIEPVKAAPRVRALDTDGRSVQLRYFMDRMITMRWSIVGDFDVPTFERALQAVIDRHDLLRAEAEVREGRLHVRPVTPTMTYRVAYHDLSRLTPDEQDRLVLREHEREHGRADRLQPWPLLRCTVFRRTADVHTLMTSVTHAICDGFTIISVLQRDLRVAYDAFAKGRLPELPPLRTTYWDWVDKIDEERNSDAARQARAYWDEVMRVPLPPQRLPADLPRSHVRSTAVDTLRSSMPEATLLRLKDRAAAEGVTLFELLLALWVRRLYLWTGVSDRVVSVPTLGRGVLDGLMDVVGCFANTLPIRQHVVAGESLSALVGRVAETFRQGLRYAEHPIERPLEASIAFTFPHFESADALATVDGLEWRLEELWNEIGLDDVDAVFLGTIIPTPRGKELLVSWTWARDLFRRETFEMVAHAFRTDLEDLAAGRPLSAEPPSAAHAGRFREMLSASSEVG